MARRAPPVPPVPQPDNDDEDDELEYVDDAPAHAANDEPDVGDAAPNNQLDEADERIADADMDEPKEGLAAGVFPDPDEEKKPVVDEDVKPKRKNEEDPDEEGDGPVAKKNKSGCSVTFQLSAEGETVDISVNCKVNGRTLK
ncbi:hypothetical protein CVT24_000727 [Panaeolus cyanescens]|uniref:Uncharacterized protein n=1 Tax=Panaeolus cyanescens TaxID=181874 RepID=A0A409YT27_9AGAR|nr:hypothetical protein CVT24_000727 [Panaeolus cyanescens]